MSLERKQHIKIEGMTNKWSAIEDSTYNGHKLYLMENDTYGDETEYLIIDEDNFIVLDNVYNGWFDLDEALEILRDDLTQGVEEENVHLMKYITMIK